ncbi:MAG: C40 family peptidase [Clostridia bacterium]|nr:C40 family peptidase [Clostridia bacterium]MDY5264860.1 C40 family peptidase [Eubacteriales bacterium]
MKNKIFILTLLIVSVIAITGCSTVNSIPQNNATTPILPENTPETAPDEVPNIRFDKLLHIHSDSLSLYTGKRGSGKKVGTVYKNDLLPILKIEDGHYVSIFNYYTVYIPTNYNVSVKEFSLGSEKVESVITEAKKLIGIPYVYGAERYHWGNGILNGKFSKYAFDCSSFTQYVYFKSNGILLDTTSRTQSLQGKTVSKDNLRRGDLMFFTTANRVHLSGLERVGHVAIYLGDNYIIHTASDYAVIEPISTKRWSYFISAKRVIFD